MEDPRTSNLQRFRLTVHPHPACRRGGGHTALELEPVTDSCIAFVMCRVAQQRGDSDDGSPSGTNAETPSGDDFRYKQLDPNPRVYFHLLCITVL